jgi:hypothetical protein
MNAERQSIQRNDFLSTLLAKTTNELLDTKQDGGLVAAFSGFSSKVVRRFSRLRSRPNRK